MKYSKQSELIKNAMHNNKDHPTADMIYAMLKPQNPSLSLATVYRNLNKLAQKGEIIKLTIPNAGDRYDSTSYEHFHMICNECGAVFDCPINPFERVKEIEDFEKMLLTNSQFMLTSMQILIYGVCKSCNSKKIST